MAYNDYLKKNTKQALKNITEGIEREGVSYLTGSVKDTSWDKNEPDINLAYSSAESSYSGTDITAVIIYNEWMVILGNVETISYSLHRDKMPVRTLGRTYAKDYVRGQRTIAGSLIFVQFDEAPLYKLYEFFNKKLENQHRFSSPVADEIPPFDLMLVFNNEYGYGSVIKMYGVEIVDEGGTFSINDIYSENVMQFIAKDIDPMVSNGKDDSFKRLLFEKMTQGKVIDEHYASLLEYRKRIARDLAFYEGQISSTAKIAKKRDHKTDWKHGHKRNDRAKEHNNDIKQAKSKYELLTNKIESLIDELARIDNAIMKYEQTKMTWDMNAAVSADYTSSSVFTDK